MADMFKELDAMKLVAEALQGLEQESISRIIHWASDHFKVENYSLTKHPKAGEEKITPPAASGSANIVALGDIAEFYTKANPESDSEKALVVGYWNQASQGVQDFDSQTINTCLKQLGHGIGNVTRAFERLIAERPQLAIQIRKSGTTKQARKMYRITNEGMKRVQQMISENQQ